MSILNQQVDKRVIDFDMYMHTVLQSENSGDKNPWVIRHMWCWQWVFYLFIHT